MKRPKYPVCKSEVTVRDFVYPCQLEKPHRMHGFWYQSSSKVVGIQWRDIAKVKTRER